MRALPEKTLFSIGLLAILAFTLLDCEGGDTSEPTTAPVPTSTSAPAAAPDPTAAPEDTGPFRISVMESVTGPGETYGTVAVQAKEMAV